jgi:hypothetical protein
MVAVVPLRSLGAGAAALIALAALGAARPAAACSVCGAGDPTLNITGAEKPYAGRLRLSADARVGGASVGATRADLIDLHEERLELALGYAPVARLYLALAMPALHRDVAYGGGRRQGRYTPGDLDLRAKWFFLQRQSGPFAHEVALTGGLRLPTAPVQRSDADVPLPAALQPGGSSVTPFGGVSYDVRRGPWLFYASTTFFVPFAVRAGTHACDVLRASTTVQYQPHRKVATRLGLDGRVESSAVTDSRTDPNAGGFIGYVSPEVLFSPTLDFVLSVSVRLPVFQALRGQHHEDTILGVGAAYDLR